MISDKKSNAVPAALNAVRHAIDVSIGSTGPNHPLREAERLLALAEADVSEGGDRALVVALHDLTEQLHPYALGESLLSFQAVEGLERYLGRTDVLYRLSQRSSSKTPSRSSPLPPGGGRLRSPNAGIVDEEIPAYSSHGRLGDSIDDDIYAEVLGVFALEARDQLHLMSMALRRLESEPQDYAARDEVVKRLRSMKGSSALVGAEVVRMVSHAAEDLAVAVLSAGVEQQEIDLLHQACSALESLTLGDAAERSVVAVDTLLDALTTQTEQTRNRIRADRSQQQEKAQRISTPTAETRSGAEADTSEAKPSKAERSDISEAKPSKAERSDIAEATDEESASHESRLREALAGRPLAAAGVWDKDQLAKLDQLVRELEEARTLVDRRRFRFESPIRSLRSTTAHMRDLAARARGVADSIRDPDTGPSETGAGQGGELRAELFDQLSNDLAASTAELATCELQLGFATTELEGDLGQLRQSIQSLKRRVGEFRQASLESLVRRLHGVVRGTAAERGKEIELVLSGFDENLDQGLVEAIGDSLLHLTKNAVEHGIESPQLRHLRGKSRVGVIRVSAVRLGPRLLIEVEDDGAGLDEKAILRKAVERGVQRPHSDRISNDDAWKLACRSGITTASGHSGSGLDLVAASLGRVAGEMAISSAAHRGTTIRLQFPTDLALTRGFIVERGDRVVAIPSAGVLRVMRLESDEEPAGRTRTILFRDESYEIKDLEECLSSEDASSVPGAPKSQESGLETELASADPLTVLLVAAGDHRCALLVDRVRDAGELAIYPPGALLDRYPGILGFALCDGDELLPVMDPTTLATGTRLRADAEPPQEEASTRDTVLVVDDVASVRRVVGLLLERLGVRTLLASNGETALRLVEAESTPPLMALIDVDMPEMSGLELTSELRDRGFRSPVYLFTSHSSNLPDIDDLDVEGYVFKPLVRRELAALLKRHRSNDSDDAGHASEDVEESTEEVS